MLVSLIALVFLSAHSCPQDVPPSGTVAAQNALRVTIRTTKNTFRCMEPITVRLQLESTSQDAVYVRQIRGRTPKFSSYRFDVRPVNGNQVSKNRFVRSGDSVSVLAVYPGKPVEETVILNQGYDLSLPGSYTIRVGAYLGPEPRPDSKPITNPGPIWSNELHFTIDDELSDPHAMDEDKFIRQRSTMEMAEGYRLRVRLNRAEYQSLEPIAAIFELTNKSGEAPELKDEPHVAVRYKIEVLFLFQGRPFKYPMTRFGEETAICTHLLDEPIARGTAHTDRFILNRHFDLSDIGEYEVRVTCLLPGEKDAVNPLKVQAPPVRVKVWDKIWSLPPMR